MLPMLFKDYFISQYKDPVFNEAGFNENITRVLVTQQKSSGVKGAPSLHKKEQT